MSILSAFARFCLNFGHITFIFPIVVAGVIFHKRDVYAKAVCFLAWVMIFNTLLKHIFKIPLFPHLGSGYAFPSGHMHAAAIFYGYILYKVNSKFAKIILGIILCCLGFSLIHCNFHNLSDIGGAVGFAVAELLIYHAISLNFGDKTVGIISVISAVAIILILSIIHEVEFHVLLAFYLLIGTEIFLSFIPDRRFIKYKKKFLRLLFRWRSQ